MNHSVLHACRCRHFLFLELCDSSRINVRFLVPEFIKECHFHALMELATHSWVCNPLGLLMQFAVWRTREAQPPLSCRERLCCLTIETSHYLADLNCSFCFGCSSGEHTMHVFDGSATRMRSSKKGWGCQDMVQIKSLSRKELSTSLSRFWPANAVLQSASLKVLTLVSSREFWI